MDPGCEEGRGVGLDAMVHKDVLGADKLCLILGRIKLFNSPFQVTRNTLLTYHVHINIYHCNEPKYKPIQYIT